MALIRMDVAKTPENIQGVFAYEKRITLSEVAISDWVQLPPGLKLGVNLKILFTGTATAQVESTQDDVPEVDGGSPDTDIEIASGMVKAQVVLTKPITAFRLNVTAHTSGDVILIARAQ